MKTSFREKHRVPRFLIPITVFICAMFLDKAAFGQELSIQKVGTNYTIQASAPADSPQTLQASQDFLAWTNVATDLTDSFSLVLEYPLVSSKYFRLIPSAVEPPPIRIVALGDSLIGDCCGWGAGLYDYLQPNATFANYASPGRGTRSALDPHGFELPSMLLVKPEYVFMEFGVVDIGTGVSEQEFESNLKSLINTVRGFNGVPFLVTVQARRLWDVNGDFIPWEHPYNPITRRVAAEMNAPLIDLNHITTDLFKRLGPTNSEFMRFTQLPDDTIHFSPLGAVWVAQLVARSLPESFKPYLTQKVFDPPPNP